MSPTQSVSRRLVSLDAFRGFTMIWMFSQSFGLLLWKDDPVLGPIARQFDHEPWHGVRAWDLIQPFFMFIVGVAMPFALANRQNAGQADTFQRALRRSLLLIACGLLARSLRAGAPVLDLINVLAQIGFTYLVAWTVRHKPWQVQAGLAFALLALHTALFLLFTPAGAPDAWTRDQNFGQALDLAVLGKGWGGSYATINCLSSAANTLFGLMAGSWLRDTPNAAQRLRSLLIAGVIGVAAGILLDPVIPLIKKIWTASFALYSAGWSFLMLALFHWICDEKRWQSWARIGVIVGANSIFIYMFHEIFERSMNNFARFVLAAPIAAYGKPAQMVAIWLVVGFQILVCYALYRRKWFLRL